MSIAIIDLDSVMFSIGHGNKVYGDDHQPIKVDGKFVYTEKTEEELIKSADSVLSTILKNCKADHYIAYIKGIDTTKTRKAINPDYKATRPKESPKWWSFVKEYLISSWEAHTVNDIEVDDMVNITRLNLPGAFIVAIDKDLLSLAGTHYKWRLKDSLDGEWVTTTEDEANTRFWADMIIGQSGDNIKGIPGKGLAYTSELFLRFKEEGDFRQVVFNEYIGHFGEYQGIQEFYKNYMSLKILDEKIDQLIPEPSSIKQLESKELNIEPN